MGQVLKTKSASIVPTVIANSYTRKPDISILRTSKRETKTIMIARYGLLECGSNYKGTISESCDTCNCPDNEDHCLNYCIKFKGTNMCNSADH